MRKAQDSGGRLGLAIGLVAAVTIARVLILVVSPLELHPDEAQYWWWSHSLNAGYFSKPPLIAWIVGAATSLLGNSEWAIRIASPVLHGFTALVIFAIGRRVFGAREGLLSALAYLTAPGVSYSAWLMSTDVPLLFCWAVALYAYLRAGDEPGWRWTILCGLALGTGLLAKYAMLYLLLGIALAAIPDAKARRMLLGPRAIAIVLIAALVAAPNVWWNLTHGLSTLAHTAANAGWLHPRYSLSNVFGFLVGQFGVFGPLLMAGFLVALLRLLSGREQSEDEIILAAFSVPPLVLMLVQAFLVSANANWAATAYVGATPIAVHELMRWGRGQALWASFCLNGIATLMLWAALVKPVLADDAGLGNAFKREEGWQALAAKVSEAAARANYNAVAVDNRSVIAELLYYAPQLRAQLRALRNGPYPRNHFQMTMPLSPGASHVLVVTGPQEARVTLAMFDSAKALATIVIPVGGHHERRTELYDAHGFHEP
jgi:4-amino-4-deoxy-L-arabinose transferase-like glycosyltransferase